MSTPDDLAKKLAAEAVTLAQATDLKLRSPALEAMKALDGTYAEALRTMQAPSVTREFEEMQRTLDHAAAATVARVADFKLSSPVPEAMKALDRNSAATAFKTAQALSISSEIEDMQRKFQSIMPSSLMETMRDLESPLMAAAKAQKLWPPPHLLASIHRPVTEFQEILTKVQSSLRSDLFKTFSAIEPLGDDFVKRMSTIQSSIGRDFSSRFLEASKGLTDIWQSSSIKLAQSLAESDRLSAERMNKALRELSAVAELRADPAQLAGVGVIGESADIIEAWGSVSASASDENTQSALITWWKKQPFEVQAFLLVLFWILQTGAAALIGEGIKAWMQAGDHQERQIVYDQVTQSFGADAARRLRCIRASTLKVRSDPNTTGKVIDSLAHGTAVEVIESQGSWSLIRYRVPHTSEFREGWAASGYLSLEIC
ncbi:MAG: SH3 domain-containing protein [Candidatus Binataceae bacterium]